MTQAEILERFVDKILVDDCWTWTGYVENTGYGRFRGGKDRVLAHRFAYEWLVGPIPEGMQIDHLCRNRACVNPAHMEPVTGKTNVLRGVGPTAVNARKTHCKRGHSLEDAYITTGGRRSCRQCKNAANREYWRTYERKRAPRRSSSVH